MHTSSKTTLLKVLGEHHKDRAEERAARSDAKVSKNFHNIGISINIYQSRVHFGITFVPIST